LCGEFSRSITDFHFYFANDSENNGLDDCSCHFDATTADAFAGRLNVE
jgi:hypothetical protein